MEDLIYRGTIIELLPTEDNKLNYFMLVESFQEDYVFQVVRLDGYHRGCIEGYIRVQENIKELNICAVTKTFLIQEFKKKVLEFKEDTFKLLDVLPKGVNLN